jgi:hypothetical protein
LLALAKWLLGSNVDAIRERPKAELEDEVDVERALAVVDDCVDEPDDVTCARLFFGDELAVGEDLSLQARTLPDPARREILDRHVAVRRHADGGLAAR